MTQSRAFTDALAAIDAGDIDALRRCLDTSPDVVHERAVGSEPPYDGYFHGASLLHHLAGNPIRSPLPRDTCSFASLLLERGADANATCGGGPAQPASTGGTVLGLLVSGAQAEQRGLTEPLLDLLLAAGALLDPAGTGGALWIALYHTVENRGQRDVASLLYDRGHDVDVCFAAGLGLQLDIAEWRSAGFDDRELDRLYRHHRGHDAPTTLAHVMSDVLLFAAVCGRDAIVRELVEHGVALDALRPWGPFLVTPLHGAAWAGWPATVRLLLDLGADATVRDPTYDTTAAGWARHCGRTEALRAFETRAS